MERAAIVGRRHRDGSDPELAARAEDPDGDLAAIRHQEPFGSPFGGWYCAKAGVTLSLPDAPPPSRHRAHRDRDGLGLAPAAGAGTLFLVDGRGWGHGVGMSQYGADGYAHAGWGYRRILTHYYSGTEVRVVPARPVRVLLAEGLPSVKISSTKPFRVVDARGKTRALKAGTQNLVARQARQAEPEAAAALRAGRGAAPARRRGLPGRARRPQAGGTPHVVNRLPLDRYLRGVVPWEMPEDWHPEALRAQAVVARSYALATLKPGTLFDLYPDTRSQVYGGIEAEEDSTNRAIGSTAGQVVTWQGRVATTFYHSTSGGRTSSNAEAWPGSPAVPYLGLGRRSLRLALEVEPLGAVPAHAGGTGAEDRRSGAARPRRHARTLRLRDGGDDRGRERRPPDALERLSPCARPPLDLVLGARPPPGGGEQPRACEREPTLVLRGFVRGLGKVRLEQQVNGGTWTTVRRVRPQANGRFTVKVTPTPDDELPARDPRRQPARRSPSRRTKASNTP